MMNVRGLGNDVKRKEIFMYLNKHAVDVAFLQETHGVHCKNQWWTTQWGGKAFFTNGTSEARGVAILFKKGLDVTINKMTKDENGRYLIMDVQIEQQDFILTNVYSPNDDDPNFFVTIFEEMSKYNSVDRIIAGDMNLVLDKKLDSIKRQKNNENAKNVILNYME